MNKRIAAILSATLIALTAPAPARANDNPDPATKRAALMEAYHRNGNSMVRKDLIDIMSELNMDDLRRFLRRFDAKNPQRAIERDWN